MYMFIKSPPDPGSADRSGAAAREGETAACAA